MAYLEDLQRAAAIEKVVWIDDEFHRDTEQELKQQVESKIRTLTTKRIPLQHATLRSIDSTAPPEIIDEKINSILALEDNDYPSLFDYLTKIEAENGVVVEPLEDLSLSQLSVFRNGFQHLETLSYKKWVDRKDEILSSANSGTLFLVDREFKKEGLGDELGDEILAEILDLSSESICIMFSHKVDHGQTNSLRLAIAKKIVNIKSHQFSVMSKRDTGSDSSDVEKEFSHSLRSVLLSRLCIPVTIGLCDKLHEASGRLLEELSSLSVEVIDSAIFQNSLEEGASEFDIISRILTISHRSAALQYFVDQESAFSLLQRVREVRAIKSSKSKLPSTTEATLHKWRIDEVIDAGKFVNPLHLPLRCGDVFKNTKTSTTYLLLAQPCDLAVRGDGELFGKRKLVEGVFALLEHREPDKGERSAIFRLKGVAPRGKQLVVDFSTAFAVNLKILELCVFNKEGTVSWKSDQIVPPQLLPGWQERFYGVEKLINEASSLKQLGYLSVSPEIHKLLYSQSDANHSFPLHREYHIRAPYSKAILAAYARYQSRYALNHDFAHGLWEDEGATGTDTP